MPNGRLKVTNETAYDTRDIRSALLACEKYLDLVGPRQVTVVYSRRGFATGYAFYPLGAYNEGFDVRLCLPRPKSTALNSGTVNDIFWLIEHELSHSKGVKHSDMRGGAVRYGDGATPPNWAKELTLRLTPPAKKLTPEERVATRAAKVDAAVTRWERRLKLAKTKLAHWRARQRYYQKRAALKENNE